MCYVGGLCDVFVVFCVWCVVFCVGVWYVVLVWCIGVVCWWVVWYGMFVCVLWCVVWYRHKCEANATITKAVSLQRKTFIGLFILEVAMEIEKLLMVLLLLKTSSVFPGIVPSSFSRALKATTLWSILHVILGIFDAKVSSYV